MTLHSEQSPLDRAKSVRLKRKVEARKINDVLSPEIDAIDAMVFIFNLQLTSQAGRRGFDPHLPLHLFNNLG